VDVKDYDLDALREQVAMVLQKNVLFFRNHQGKSALGR
jgi:ABC-type multidrug transport system fused ATPase/permease subunit